MPKIVQFLHTAVEATPENIIDTMIPWNNHNEHRRKFIYSKGKYVENEIESKDTPLTFWGEWEPQSRIVRLRNTKPYLPKFLNYPYLDPTVPNRTHNTDPYVFGQNFRYIVCKQGYSDILRNLVKNSLILFGSCIDKKFCLDTMFVVSDIIQKYSNKNIEEIFNQKDNYYHASVNPLYDDTKYNKDTDAENTCRIEPNKVYSFYKGVNFDEKDKYNDIYSFVPCKIYNSDKELDYIFKQPIIYLDIISENQTQGINACNGREFSEFEIVNYWNKIVDQVDQAKLLKGVYFKNPELKR